MSDAGGDEKVVQLSRFRRYRRDVWLCDTLMEGDELCNSARFFLTPDGAECVYCGQLAKDWP